MDKKGKHYTAECKVEALREHLKNQGSFDKEEENYLFETPRLITDNGSQFIPREFKTFLQHL